MNKQDGKHYSGFAAIVGRPNVGKSTLTNGLIGEKIAIMSDRPQTTRNKIMCIMNTDNAQIMFLDTPGIHKPQHKLGQYMVRAAESTLHEVDVVLFVVDVSEKRGAGEDYILEQLRRVKTPVILVANKIDKLADKGKLFGIIESYTKDFAFAAVVPVSALQDTEFPGLVSEITRYLPEGPAYFPDDMITDQPERIIAAEMIREKVLRSTRDEVPHSIAVEIDEFKVRDNDDIYIRANIFVERESQKGIVIGAKGSLLKKIGEQARRDIESLLGNKVFLDLWVKVKPDWRNKDKALKQFGYEG
ncbi:GTPase Era [Phascolarctobacterium faecium]|uniref:GTPase Era n=8 Tax=Phascolarctobacterium faecium TaxID=33025 RepID=A0A7X2XFQ9_9FIRM|nr:GTPase Era [Phascolarctobacterium faecium]MTS81110.1 GTPase Era [Phascolarctobacterium faecium]MTT02338.1 GTPase Era [Phascolarctobacterium faecium]MTT16423.1 GTPase Era [Phascolarctobacterium faecium]MTT34521.1 GTPase Era [Phascolarctobacterium faecium]MTT49991.1 GTPase Era [Phascolarctobacterium faecium]